MSLRLLRERIRGAQARVTNVELLFDLVFVFAITQISHALRVNLSWSGALHAGLVLMAVWWAWVYTAWCTNWLEPDHPVVRLMLFALMAAGLVLSTALPEAFTRRGLVFAGAYVAFQLGRTVFMLWATRGRPVLWRNFLRIAIWLTVSAVLWLSGGWASGGERLGLWIAALGLDYLSPAVNFRVPGLGRSATGDWTVEGGHIAERVGLFLIIVLGESVLVTGQAFADLTLNAPVLAAFATALGSSLAMWWVYFNAAAEAAGAAIARSDDPGRMARLAYTFIPILLVAGILVGAVGDELVLTHPLAPTAPAAGLVLIGGPALFLLGALLFKRSVFGFWSPARLTALILALAMALLIGRVSTLALASAATSLIAGVGLWETIGRTGQDR
jgi:low temperature requirement protein LtrA